MTREFTGTAPEGETVPGRPRDLARPVDRSRKKDMRRGRGTDKDSSSRDTDRETQIKRYIPIDINA